MTSSTSLNAKVFKVSIKSFRRLITLFGSILNFSDGFCVRLIFVSY